MGIGRRIARSVLGAFVASVVGAFAGSFLFVAFMYAHGAPGLETTVEEVARSFIAFGMFGLLVCVPSGLVIGAPAWFLMDRGTLTPLRGAVVGVVVGSVLGVPVLQVYVPVAAVAGAFAGWVSVAAVNRLLGRPAAADPGPAQPVPPRPGPQALR